MQKIDVLFKVVNGFGGQLEVRTNALIDCSKGTYHGELAKNYGALRITPKYDVSFKRLQNLCMIHKKFNELNSNKGQIELSGCNCNYFKGINKSTGEVYYGARINLGTETKPCERNFYIPEEHILTLEGLGIHLKFEERETESEDALDLATATTEDNVE